MGTKKTSPYDPTAKVLGLLKRVTPVGGEYKALCPAHDDSDPSLSVRRGKNGRALLCCHSGCSTAAIVTALGLKMGDLYPKNGPNTARTIKAVYPYVDAAGKLLFEVIRYSDGGFTQRRPFADGTYAYRLGDVERVPYRLPALLSAIQASRPIYVVEGEKDADRLAQLGLDSTTGSNGAARKWPASFFEHFRGAPQIIVLGDSDADGRRAAVVRARGFSSLCDDVRRLDLAPHRADGFDVSDWLDAGGSLDQLHLLVQAATPVSPFDVAGGEHSGVKATSPQGQSLFIKLHDEVLRRGDLSLTDAVIYSYLVRQVAWSGHSSRKQIAGALGLETTTVWRALKRLAANSFIEYNPSTGGKKWANTYHILPLPEEPHPAYAGSDAPPIAPNNSACCDEQQSGLQSATHSVAEYNTPIVDHGEHPDRSRSHCTQPAIPAADSALLNAIESASEVSPDALVQTLLSKTKSLVEDVMMSHGGLEARADAKQKEGADAI